MPLPHQYLSGDPEVAEPSNQKYLEFGITTPYVSISISFPRENNE